MCKTIYKNNKHIIKKYNFDKIILHNYIYIYMNIYKYNKYKTKYINYKNLIGGAEEEDSADPPQEPRENEQNLQEGQENSNKINVDANGVVRDRENFIINECHELDDTEVYDIRYDINTPIIEKIT